MRAVNKQLVAERSREVRASIDRIRELVAVDDTAYFADDRNQYSVQFLLLTAMEATASICGHLMATTAGSAPSSYGECLDGLGASGIIDPELNKCLIQMARFRNLLVHRYWEVDEHRVLDYARHHLGDFEAYLVAVGEWLDGPRAV